MANSQIGSQEAIASTVVKPSQGGNQLFTGSYVPVSTVARDDSTDSVDSVEKSYLDRIAAVRADSPNSAEEIDLLAQLARHYLNNGDAEKARLYLENSRRCAEIVYGGQHPMVAELMIELGFVSFRMQEYELARQYLEPAVVIFEQAYGKVSDQVAYAFHKLGRVHEAIEDLERAEYFYQKAVTTYQNTFNEDESDMLSARNDLSRVKTRNSQS